MDASRSNAVSASGFDLKNFKENHFVLAHRVICSLLTFFIGFTAIESSGYYSSPWNMLLPIGLLGLSFYNSPLGIAALSAVLFPVVGSLYPQLTIFQILLTLFYLTTTLQMRPGTFLTFLASPLFFLMGGGFIYPAAYGFFLSGRSAFIWGMLTCQWVQFIGRLYGRSAIGPALIPSYNNGAFAELGFGEFWLNFAVRLAGDPLFWIQGILWGASAWMYSHFKMKGRPWLWIAASLSVLSGCSLYTASLFDRSAELSLIVPISSIIGIIGGVVILNLWTGMRNYDASTTIEAQRMEADMHSERRKREWEEREEAKRERYLRSREQIRRIRKENTAQRYALERRKVSQEAKYREPGTGVEEPDSSLAVRGQSGATGRIRQSPGSSRAGRRVTWDDLILEKDIKGEIERIVLNNFDPHRVSLLGDYGIQSSRSLLLFGPPGCGKTRLAQALKDRPGLTLHRVSCADIASKWFGETEKNIRQLFDKALSEKPSILFFDEMESLTAERSNAGQESTAVNRIVTQFLQEFDRVREERFVMIIGTTNAPELMDAAFLRPGRFDKALYIPPPGLEERKRLFNLYLNRRLLDESVDVDRLAEKTERYSGADIESVCIEAVTRSLECFNGDQVMPSISQDMLEEHILKMRPSLNEDILRKHEEMRDRFQRGAIDMDKKIRGKAMELSWDDLGGMDSIKKFLEDNIILPLKRPDLFKKFGAGPPSGILLYGPPGCGKTHIARVCASVSNALFIEVRGSELISPYRGRSEQNLHRLFQRARSNSPSILYFDELEALAGSRGHAGPGEKGDAGIIGQFLTEFDGFEPLEGCIVLASTNRPDLLDRALLRPGRFEKIMFVPPPESADERLSIMTALLRERPCSSNVDLQEIAQKAAGFSSADLKALCNEAAMNAVKRCIKDDSATYIEEQDFYAALENIKPSLTTSVIRFYDEIQTKMAA